MQNQSQQFTEDEIQNLREIFDLFDKEKSNCISTKDLETIMGSLQRDPAEVREFIENIDPNSNGTITFEEFINLM
jgi:Ca2+-binding EF-hand superfamily protein